MLDNCEDSYVNIIIICDKMMKMYYSCQESNYFKIVKMS